MKKKDKYKKSLNLRRAADSGFVLGSARLPSCSRPSGNWCHPHFATCESLLNSTDVMFRRSADISFSRGIDLIANATNEVILGVPVVNRARTDGSSSGAKLTKPEGAYAGRP
jgi:hypothetical protein